MSGLFILLFFISIIGLIVGLIQPKIYSRLIKRSLSRKMVGLIFGGLIIASLLLSGVTSDNKQASKSFQAGYEQGSGKKVEATPEEKKADYKVVSYEDNKNVENLWVFTAMEDKSKEEVENLTRSIKKEKCKKPCNISVYDDQKAIDLDLQYNKIRDIAEATAWKEKNYIYVADHLLGYLEFEGDGIFGYYPFKDSYYKQLKGE